jgi:predicted DNA-binding ribbon-helix-helix protein
VKTETSSFRLEKEVFEDFKKHAKEQGLTTNSMINKIMKEYVQWGSKTSAMQIIPYPSKILMKLLKTHTEEELRKIAREHVMENFQENLLLLKNEESVEAYIEMMKNYCDAAGFPYSEKEKNGVLNFTIRHNQGNKTSFFLDELIITQIEMLTKERAKTKVMNNSVSFWI